MHTAQVLFGTAARRYPLRVQWPTYLIQALTVSRLAHCAVAYDGVVADFGLKGVRFLPLTAVLKHHPALHAIVRVPLHYGLNLAYFEQFRDEPIPFWPTFSRWCDMGRTPYVSDCLGCTCAALEAGGLDMPTGIASPAELYRFLVKKGFPHASKTDPDWAGTAARLCEPHT